MKETLLDNNPVEESTDPSVPGLSSWRSVYIFIIVLFVLYVALMTAFTVVFS